jgi:4-amino-4-deoxy-L-arabinose transferase-like glycosyltransferase
MTKRKIDKTKKKSKSDPLTVSSATDSQDTPYPHQKWVFLGLMCMTFLLRLIILFNSRHYLDSDEAVIAMESLDIIAGEPIPFFLYGQVYGGGHTVEALMAAPLFFLFGPIDYLLKISLVIFACLHILLVYITLYQFFNKRFALIASAVFSIFSTFFAFNFRANGGMVTLMAGWLGWYLFFQSYFSEKEKKLFLLFSGIALGFAYYCFDFALYYLLGVFILWVLKDRLQIWKKWASLLTFTGGFFIGAMPLVYYNLANDFANIKGLLLIAGPGSSPLYSTLKKFGVLLAHDLPAFFSLDVNDFPSEISPISYLSYGLFLLAVIYTIMKTARPFFSLTKGSLARRGNILDREDRIAYILLLLFLYLLIYCLSASGGKATRYLIPLSPLVPIVLAWPICFFRRRWFIPAVTLAFLFGGIQLYYLVQLAQDDTVLEWRNVTHGEDVKKLATFLLDNNFTTVMTPYEIKWKLMFASQRKIIAASYMFGFDREHKYNREVVERVNHQNVPLTVVFDKAYKLPQIALNFNPQGAFDVEGFHQFLRQNNINYRITPVGRDYLVYHGFSEPIRLPDPYKNQG